MTSQNLAPRQMPLFHWTRPSRLEYKKYKKNLQQLDRFVYFPWENVTCIDGFWLIGSILATRDGAKITSSEKSPNSFFWTCKFGKKKRSVEIQISGAVKTGRVTGSNKKQNMWKSSRVMKDSFIERVSTPPDGVGGELTLGALELPFAIALVTGRWRES